MTDITRIESKARMSRVVGTDGIVYVGGLTAGDASQDIEGQTAQVLKKIEHYLGLGGSDKSRMISATIWLKDIERDFAGMNEVWDKWLDAGTQPVRATGESKLARNDLLVEIIVTAKAK